MMFLTLIIILLQFLIEGVSTIPDECKGVGCEIGTHSKRKAILLIDKIEDIVSANGDIGVHV